MVKPKPASKSLAASMRVSVVYLSLLSNELNPFVRTLNYESNFWGSVHLWSGVLCVV
jgi:hypothetical protein